MSSLFHDIVRAQESGPAAVACSTTELSWLRVGDCFVLATAPHYFRAEVVQIIDDSLPGRVQEILMRWRTPTGDLDAWYSRVGLQYALRDRQLEHCEHEFL